MTIGIFPIRSGSNDNANVQKMKVKLEFTCKVDK